MSEFDFDRAERELALVASPVTLRERAAVAYTELHKERERRLLVAAHETLFETVGETDAQEVKITVNLDGYGHVDLTVDNIRFRAHLEQVEVKDEISKEKELVEQRTLKMMGLNASWVKIETIEDIGRLLAKDPCYAKPPAKPKESE